MSWVEVVIVALGMLVVLQGLLTAALVRRVAGLAEGGQPPSPGPQVATRIEPVAARTLGGEEVEGIALDAALIAVLSQACGSCEDAAARLTAAVRSGEVADRVVVLVVGTGAAPDYVAGLGAVGEVYRLDGFEHPFLTANRIRMYPFFVRTDAEGLVRAASGDLSAVAAAPARGASDD